MPFNQLQSIKGTQVKYESFVELMSLQFTITITIMRDITFTPEYHPIGHTAATSYYLLSIANGRALIRSVLDSMLSFGLNYEDKTGVMTL